MNILVTGGAGYIGSHTVKALRKQGYQVAVIDNLSAGHQENVPPDVPFIKADIGDSHSLEPIFKTHKITAVIHFAGSIEAGESMRDPGKYFRNNTANTLALLTTMKKYNVKNIVFSSTAAVYGEPQYTPLDEEHPKQPTNYYGLSKLMIEQMLDAFEKAYGFRHVSLRYFNAAGADEEGEFGEDHYPETHLIPLLIQTALGLQKEARIFGDDYPTPDGTCIRDFIHVADLAEAHVLAVEYLQQGNPSNYFNLGSGKGHSVKEVIRMVQKITKKDFPIIKDQRRAGDPAILIASSKKIHSVLGWRARRDVQTIITTAWQWHLKRHGQG